MWKLPRLRFWRRSKRKTEKLAFGVSTSASFLYLVFAYFTAQMRWRLHRIFPEAISLFSGMIGYMQKIASPKGRKIIMPALAALIEVHFFDVFYQKKMWNVQIWSFDEPKAVNLSFSAFNYFKTILARQINERTLRQFLYHVTNIIAKLWSDVFVAALPNFAQLSYTSRNF